MVASLPLEGVETNMLLLESGRSYPEIGIEGVQSYLYTVCICARAAACASMGRSEGRLEYVSPVKSFIS